MEELSRTQIYVDDVEMLRERLAAVQSQVEVLRGSAAHGKLEWEQVSGHLHEITARLAPSREKRHRRGLRAGCPARGGAPERPVSRRRLLEVNRELARSNADLEQFALIASHDLQEPLRVVMGFLDLLRQRSENRLDPESSRYLDNAAEGVRRMRDLTRSLLSYARAGACASSDEWVDASQAFSAALANLEVSIRESGARVRCAPLPRVRMEMPLLVQILQNLVGNAIKFRSAEPPRIKVQAARDSHGWRFRVLDNGMGVAPENAQRIFRLFERIPLRGRVPGVGFGLAICKKIVERRGGRIWVSSRTEQGSAFYFTIPDAIPDPVTS